MGQKSRTAALNKKVTDFVKNEQAKRSFISALKKIRQKNENLRKTFEVDPKKLKLPLSR